MSRKLDLARLTKLKTPLEVALIQFLADRELRGCRQATRAFYRTEANLFIRFANEANVSAVEDIDGATMRAYFAALKTHRNSTSVHTAWRALKTWLTWCWCEYDLSEKMPMAKITVAKPDSEPRQGISLPEIDKLLSACVGPNARRDTAIVLLLIDTGIRRRELCALDAANLDTGKIYLDAPGTKSGKGRYVFFSRRTARAINDYLDTRLDIPDDAPLFTTDENERMTVNGLRAVIIRLCKRAGISIHGLHDFRRTFAIESLRAGGDLLAVAKLLGHSTTEQTIRYLKLTDDDLKAIHDKTSPVAKLKGRRR